MSPILQRHSGLHTHFGKFATAAIAIPAAGTLLSLCRTHWRLWGAMTVLWIVYCLTSGYLSSPDLLRDPLFYLIIFGPPTLLLTAFDLLRWIFGAFVRDTIHNPDTSTADDPQRAHNHL